jgi:hypothetical protein
MALKINQTYKDIADALIAKYPQNFGQIDTDQILFLCEDEKSPAKYAEIQKVKSPYTFVTSYKFIMIVYSPKTIAMTQAQINLLIMHELCHIDQDFEKLVKHDLEDFVSLCSIYGCDWDVNPMVKDPLI